MKLSDKQHHFLNNKCIERFGIPFDELYKAIEENEKMKEELKRKEKELKKLKKK